MRKKILFMIIVVLLFILGCNSDKKFVILDGGGENKSYWDDYSEYLDEENESIDLVKMSTDQIIMNKGELREIFGGIKNIHNSKKIFLVEKICLDSITSEKNFRGIKFLGKKEIFIESGNVGFFRFNITVGDDTYPGLYNCYLDIFNGNDRYFRKYFSLTIS